MLSYQKLDHPTVQSKAMKNGLMGVRIQKQGALVSSLKNRVIHAMHTKMMSPQMAPMTVSALGREVSQKERGNSLKCQVVVGGEKGMDVKVIQYDIHIRIYMYVHQSVCERVRALNMGIMYD